MSVAVACPMSICVSVAVASVVMSCGVVMIRVANSSKPRSGALPSGRGSPWVSYLVLVSVPLFRAGDWVLVR